MQPHGAPTCPPKVAFEMSANWPRSTPPSGAIPPPVTRQPMNVVDVDDDVLVEVLVLLVEEVLVLELLDDVVDSLVDEVVVIDVVVVVGGAQQRPSFPKSAPTELPTKWPCSVLL